MTDPDPEKAARLDTLRALKERVDRQVSKYGSDDDDGEQAIILLAELLSPSPATRLNNYGS